MILWAITEIGFDCLIIWVIASEKASKLRRIIASAYIIILVFDILGIIDYTMWKFVTEPLTLK